MIPYILKKTLLHDKFQYYLENAQKTNQFTNYGWAAKELEIRARDMLKIDESKYKFDGICMSYGLRNLSSVEKGIQKVFNLLNDEGKAGFLDFNHSKDNSLSNIFQKIYLRLIVVPISKIFKLSKEYSYIEKSVRNYPEGN